jgi:hypothetical protein
MGIPQLEFDEAHRLAGKVKRWHTAFTVQTQTVADHVYNLMRIYVAIFGDPSPDTWRMMLLHDFEELYTGDIPHGTARLPEMADAKRNLEERIWCQVHPGAMGPGYWKSDDAKILVADWIEALEFISEERRLGNRTPMLNMPALHKRLMDHIAPMREKDAVVAYLERTGFYRGKAELFQDAKLMLDGVEADEESDRLPSFKPMPMKTWP